MLVYAASAATDESAEAVWYDRSGRQLDVPPIPASALGLRLSADGRWLSTIRSVGRPELWMHDLVRRIPLRITSLSDSPNVALSVDGSRIAFRNDDSALVEQLVSGATPPAVLVQGTPRENLRVMDWSADGETLLFGSARSGRPGVYRLPLTGTRTPVPYLVGGPVISQAALSPDGRWTAYTEVEGQPQVFVQPFPDPSGGKWPVSGPGGFNPRWRRDGRELFFIQDTYLAAAPVALSLRPDIGTPTRLFELPNLNWTASPGFLFDVSPDGQQFVIARPRTDNPIMLTVAVNWASAAPRPR
jgi:Tol biopolymer transport system component